MSKAADEVGHVLPTSREVRVSMELQAKSLPAGDKERLSWSLSQTETGQG